MKPEDLKFLSEAVKSRSGLALTADKVYLLESRLNPLAREEGFDSLDGLIAKMRKDRNGRLFDLVTEAMTTNETYFFRDKRPFELLEEVVYPALVSKRPAGKPLRIWTAAASSGQELYSIAMLSKEKRALLGGRDLQLLGTDISKEILEKAKNGVYTQFEVQRGLPMTMLVKYFSKEGDRWRLKPEILKMGDFRCFNLLDDLAPLGQFDVVFCRNVLIYFDAATKRSVLERIYKQMAPDGYLLLGAAETVTGITQAFRLVPGQRGLYERNPEFGASRAA